MSEEDISRRKVLRATAVSASAAAGMGTASAGDEPEAIEVQSDELKHQYEDAAQRREAIEAHAGDVLEELADRDIIAGASPNELDLETELDRTRIPASEEENGWAVTEYTNQDDVRTAHVMVSKITDEYNLTLHVQPEAERGYALVEAIDSDEAFAIDPSTDEVEHDLTSDSASDSGELSLHSSGCDDFTSCTDDICDTQDGPDPISTIVYHTKIHHACSSSSSGTQRCYCWEDGTSCACSCIAPGEC